jgi:TetR/AcrR family transcriptional repressor of nem operon
MGRKIEFNYNKAIDKATRLFWQKGYSNASLRELLKAMKIGEGSFYNSVKSKKHLYLECLKHYNDTVGRRRLNALTSPPTAKEGIRAFFQTVLDELDDPRTPRVCLLAGSLSGDVLAARDLRRCVLAEMEMLVACFAKRLEAAKLEGELPEDFDVDVAASVIVTYLQGLFRTIRVLYDRAQAEKQMEALLAGLGL